MFLGCPSYCAVCMHMCMHPQANAFFDQLAVDLLATRMLYDVW